MFSVGTSRNILLLFPVTKCCYEITAWNFAEAANSLVVLPKCKAAWFKTNCKLLAVTSCRQL